MLTLYSPLPILLFPQAQKSLLSFYTVIHHLFYFSSCLQSPLILFLSDISAFNHCLYLSKVNVKNHGPRRKTALQPYQNRLTFQVTAGGGRKAFLRFTPHQFQAYLQHFHLLSFPSRWKMLSLVQMRRPSNVSPLHVSNRRKIQTQDKNWIICTKPICVLKEKKLVSSSLYFQLRKSSFSSVLSETEKAESGVRQSLPTFSSERLHVFFPPSFAVGLLHFW